MTDYYPLIAKAVAGLEKNTGDQRRALYERARTALVAQLRGLDPPLSESPLTREPIITEPSARDAPTEMRDTSGLRDPAPNLRDAFSPARDSTPPPEPPAAKREPDRSPKDQPPRRSFLPDPPPEMAQPRRPGPQPDAPAARAPSRGRTRPPPLTDQGLRGFRDVVVEA